MKYTDATIKNVYEVNPEIKEIIHRNKIYQTITDVDKKNHDILVGVKKGLFLHGVAGSGKTYTLYAIRNALQQWKLNCSQIENWVEFLFEIRDRYSNNQSVKSVLEYFMEKDFIFIDDIGAENHTQNSQELLYLILDRANRYEKKIFISTNLSLEEFTTKYGDRLMSRIFELCEFHEMKDDDLRLKK